MLKSYGVVISKNLRDWEDVPDKISFPDRTRHDTAIKISVQEFEKLARIALPDKSN